MEGQLHRADGKLYEAPHTFATKVDAEAWLTDRRREIDRELWSPDAKPGKRAGRRPDPTLADYAKQWLGIGP